MEFLLLSKLLVESSFHPAILANPYLSSALELSKKVAYLKQGLLIWKEDAHISS